MVVVVVVGCRYLAAAREYCSCCGLSYEADCVGVVVILDYLHTNWYYHTKVDAIVLIIVAMTVRRGYYLCV